MQTSELIESHSDLVDLMTANPDVATLRDVVKQYLVRIGKPPVDGESIEDTAVRIDDDVLWHAAAQYDALIAAATLASLKAVGCSEEVDDIVNRYLHDCGKIRTDGETIADAAERLDDDVLRDAAERFRVLVRDEAIVEMRTLTDSHDAVGLDGIVQHYLSAIGERMVAPDRYADAAAELDDDVLRAAHQLLRTWCDSLYGELIDSSTTLADLDKHVNDYLSDVGEARQDGESDEQLIERLGAYGAVLREAAARREEIQEEGDGCKPRIPLGW